jgi:hypothetical protein
MYLTVLSEILGFNIVVAIGASSFRAAPCESSYELNNDRLSCRADSELVELHASRQRNAIARGV